MMKHKKWNLKILLCLVQIFALLMWKNKNKNTNFNLRIILCNNYPYKNQYFQKDLEWHFLINFQRRFSFHLIYVRVVLKKEVTEDSYLTVKIIINHALASVSHSVSSAIYTKEHICCSFCEVIRWNKKIIISIKV